ncbi:cytosolic phospholipase A2 gamma-like [Scleropages formosus]|uniref:cytosolic phospholipase A2 gamma-like n=1 Tax=Scleropages formosus TaxID=113540 RepID=UPI0010FA85BC|nr:cytosolic phospholipase A2 gamma-like [Scleropages formosus]XP_029105447.1 cytosolic phospholipase A2 gamma-like [Scleropages formosus]
MTDRSRDAASVQREYVRVSKSLNRKEEQYVKERQAMVEKCLKDNGIKYKQEHVPVIAVLGSGGGERAMVGLLGSLAQMAEEKLLDSITYLCGVSGSTWCMASLYEDPKWSVNVAADKKKIVDRLSNGSFSKSDMLKWLSVAVEDENYSLTDFWAATVVYNIIKEIDRHHLSEQEARDSTNPYPIYTAIDKGLKEDNQTAPCWFEISPHEAGYSHVGAYVDTSLFGSQFENGKPKTPPKEEDMLYLQGLCGSALGDGKENITQILQWIWDWIHKLLSHFQSTNKSENSALNEDPAYKMLERLVQLHDSFENDDKSVVLLEKIIKLQQESNTNSSRVRVLQKNEWLKLNAEERQTYVADLSIEICNALEGLFGPLKGIPDIVRKTIIALYNWTWGTKFNFLYKYPAKEVEHIPAALLSDEKRDLEDAGILLNSPYVAALRSERKVDLILSFDFSSDDPFLTVKKAADYCKEAGRPFPSLVIEPGEEKNPKDFYVFKDNTKAPIVVHFPLFNTVNCGEKIEKWRKRYKTFQGPYSKEMIEDLLLVSSRNVKNNKQKILNEIQAACAR